MEQTPQPELVDGYAVPFQNLQETIDFFQMALEIVCSSGKDEIFYIINKFFCGVQICDYCWNRSDSERYLTIEGDETMAQARWYVALEIAEIASCLSIPYRHSPESIISEVYTK